MPMNMWLKLPKNSRLLFSAYITFEVTLSRIKHTKISRGWDINSSQSHKKEIAQAISFFVRFFSSVMGGFYPLIAYFLRLVAIKASPISFRTFDFPRSETQIRLQKSKNWFHIDFSFSINGACFCF